MANGEQNAKGSWNNESQMEASCFETDPEMGMWYLEGEDWSEIRKTMLIQDNDDDTEEGQEEEGEVQSRTMMIMDDEDSDDNYPDHDENKVGCNDERKSLRKSGRTQKALTERYVTNIGKHASTIRAHSPAISQQYDNKSFSENCRPTRAHSFLILQQYEESRRDGHRPTRTRWSVIQQRYEESLGKVCRPMQGNCSVTPQQYNESRRENNRPIRTHSSVNPQQYNESRGEKNRPIRTHSSVRPTPQHCNESRGEINRPIRAHSAVAPQQYNESHGENTRPIRAHSSVTPQQYHESRGENNRPIRAHSSVAPQQYNESRAENNRPIRAHSSVIPQQYNESRGENNRPKPTRWSVIPQQNDKSRGENYLPIRANSSVTTQNYYDESVEKSYRPTRAHSSAIPQRTHESRGEDYLPKPTHFSVIPPQNDESVGKSYRPTRVPSAIPQQFLHESRAETYLPLRSHSSATSKNYNANLETSYRPTRAHSSVVPQNDENRGLDYLPTQAPSPVNPQQYDESLGKDYRPAQANSSAIPLHFDESLRENNNRPTRTRWSVIPHQYNKSRGDNYRRLSLQQPAEQRLKEFNLQSCEDTETPEGRTKSRQTGEGVNDDNSQCNQSSAVISCKICFSEEVPALRRFCCSFPICHSCFDKYLSTQIDDGKDRIGCPNYECRSVVPFDEVFQTVDSDRRMKLERLATVTLRKKGFKACPQCNAITVASETLLSKAKQERGTFKVTCPVCELEWCYDCETPWHRGRSTCEKVKSNEKMFKEWTKRYSDSEKSEKNARRCPKCKVYIQKSTGCDKMTCRCCGTMFCYKCGRRIGSSSAHRCYEFLPNLNDSKGTIFLMVLLAPLAIPAIVAVAAFSLPILIGYGGYKIVKAARRRQGTRIRRDARE